MVCGSPRSGTALLSAMLFQPPHVVAVMEPWDGLGLTPGALFRSLRAEMADGSLTRGRLDTYALAEGRVRWRPDRSGTAPVEVNEDTIVAVKWPTYWQYLGVFPDARFLVCVRDPAELVWSYRAEGGALRFGRDYDVAFNRHLHDALPPPADTDDARMAMIDHINTELLRHIDRDNVHVVRYERWQTDPDAQLDEIAEFLGVSRLEATVRIDPPSTALTAADRFRLRSSSSTADRLGYPA